MRYASVPLLALAALAAAEERVPSTSDADQATSGETVVVTADRQPSSLESTTATVSVIAADEDRRDGHPASWTERLRRTPGVDLLNRNGGLDGGGLPGLRLRGTQSDSDTQILVDGIPWNDPTGTQGQPSLLSLQPSGIGRIEVVRGAQSGLYGSQAVGGVVNLIGERPTAEQHGRLRLEGGSFHIRTVDGAVTGPLIAGERGGAPALGFAAGVSATDSDGFSALTTHGDGDPGDAEDDGLRRLGGNGRIEGSPFHDLTLYAAGWAGSARHDYDESGPEEPVPEKRERLWRGAGGGAWHLPLLDSTVAFDAAYTRIQRDLDGNFSAARFTGGEWYWSTRWTVPVLPWLTLTPGVDATHQRADSESGGVAVYDQRLVKDLGTWAQALIHAGDWDASLVARRDARTNAGDATTWRAGVAWMPWDSAVGQHAAVGTPSDL
jgi:outer membrane cobalamin receptor